MLIFLKLSKKTIDNFVAWDGKNGWIWCRNIDPVYETNIMSLLNFFTTLRQSCVNVTIRPYINYIWHSSKSWRNVAGMHYWCWESVGNLMSRFQRCIHDIQYPRHIVRWTYHSMLRSYYRRCENVVNLTLWFQHCTNVVKTTFILYCELKLLSNVETTLEIRWYFDVLISKLLRRCVLVVWRDKVTTLLPQRCVFVK